MNFTNEEGARFEPAITSSGVLAGSFDKSIMYAEFGRGRDYPSDKP